MGHFYGVVGGTHAVTPVVSEARPWKRACLWLAGLGALFFSSYNAANWLASQRTQVPSMAYAWESVIPYWPWTIVPYWSIDLFYAASLFVCATRRELDTHARRLLTVQLLSVAIFVIAPLQFTFVRPETTGLFGALLDALLAFDKPFNQAPALHISLLVILWVHYAAHLKGAWRALLHGWFALIGLSVLTTYQHHFFDVPTGAWMGWFCVWLFPQNAPPVAAHFRLTNNTRRRQLAALYFAGAVLLAITAMRIGGWGLWLLWGAGSLLLVAWIYVGLGAAAFQKLSIKNNSLSCQWLLAPYQWGATVNARWWTRNTFAAHAITPQVWLGRLPRHATDVPPGIKSIVDLCAELPCPATSATSATHIAIPALDLVPLTTAQLAPTAQAIADAIAQGPVLVCCALGYSRSAAAVAAWLIYSGQVNSAQAAIALIRQARPHIVVSAAQCAMLDALSQPH